MLAEAHTLNGDFRRENRASRCGWLGAASGFGPHRIVRFEREACGEGSVLNLTAAAGTEWKSGQKDRTQTLSRVSAAPVTNAPDNLLTRKNALTACKK